VNVRTGARRLLLSLRQLPLRTVILTNGSVEPQWRKIEAAGFASLVDAVVISEAIGFHKPDQRAFSAALARVIQIQTPPQWLATPMRTTSSARYLPAFGKLFG
jgi:beta-phosphoglucomutase-like phosphatase (HAD superfamily)